MFASDSDIKDIAEGSEPTSGGPSSLVSTAGAAGSSPTDSVATLLAGTSANTTPRKADPEAAAAGQGEDNDINANPRLVS
jgi:hypothetical protein